MSPKNIALVAAALGAALAVPAAASAAAPWTVPQIVPGSSGSAVLAPSLSHGRGSAGIVGWSTSPAPFDVLAAQRAAGATAFGPAETVTDSPPGANDSPPAVDLDPSTGQPVAAFTGRGGLFVSARTG